MSSGDYIRYRRVMNRLQNLDKLPRVLTGTQYAEFKGISLEKNIQPADTKYEYWSLLQTEARVMGGILRLKPSNCPDFCDKTDNLRPNAVLQIESVPPPGPRAPIAMKLKDPETLSIKSSCRCTRTF